MLFSRRVGGVIVLIFMGAGPFLCVKKARQDKMDGLKSL